MKKFVLILLIGLLCLPVLTFAACAEPADDPYDLSTKEIGYEIPVYPDCEFSYAVEWTDVTYVMDEAAAIFIDIIEEEKSCVINITDISVVLTEKNEISPDKTIEEGFYPYTVKVTLKGSAPSEYAGLKIKVALADSFGGASFVCDAIPIQADGSISLSEDLEIGVTTPHLYFRDIEAIDRRIDVVA